MDTPENPIYNAVKHAPCTVKLHITFINIGNNRVAQGELIDICLITENRDVDRGVNFKLVHSNQNIDAT